MRGVSPQGFKCEKTALEKALAADFEANEKRYREGCAGHRFSHHGLSNLPSRKMRSPLTGEATSLHGEKGFSRG